jgi:hypothetical protein
MVKWKVAPVVIRVGSRYKRTEYGYYPFCDRRVQDLCGLGQRGGGDRESGTRVLARRVQSTTHSDRKFASVRVGVGFNKLK